MSRRAILIEASNTKYGDLPGARKDVDNFSAFLHANHGGAWNWDEITILRNPPRNNLDDVLLKARNDEYVLITYSGHGEHKVGGILNDTYLAINDNDDVPVWKINPGNDRYLFIIDTCRKIVQITESERGFIAKAAEFAGSQRELYRRAFDAGVAQCEKGGILMYSTDLDEAAGENALGGYFSRFLVECGDDWGAVHNGGGLQVFSTRDAFQCAYGKVNGKYPQQHPQYEPGRRMYHFPFAVSV